jgi:hypothetical protein
VASDVNMTSGAVQKVFADADGKVKVKRKIKDSVFLNLFSDKNISCSCIRCFIRKIPMRQRTLLIL